ncbi:MAG: AraC family transcriptional regulator, partial [Oxalobacteraceae bacterium]
NSTFWYDNQLPFIEARAVRDGRQVCFDKHSHDSFSIGVITHGQAIFLNNGKRQVSQGDVTIMNPGEVHACNPIGGAGWSYRMFYVETEWFGRIQADLRGGREGEFSDLGQVVHQSPALFHALNALYSTLTSRDATTLSREVAATKVFGDVFDTLGGVRRAEPLDSDRISIAADFIRDNWKEDLGLDEICTVSGLSASYLIRSFRRRFGLTPYAYLINRRIQKARKMLRDGANILDVAYATRFYDQAHFQRTFKRFTAVNPGLYATEVSNHAPANAR